ncbi:MAG: hypothetical protein RIT14_2685 [Pseudomonadota bacterium]
MGIAIDTTTAEGWHAALAALAWQVDLGVTEVIGDSPVNGYDLPDRVQRPAGGASPAVRPPGPAAPQVMPALSAAQREAEAGAEAVAVAQALAAAAGSLEALREALAGFDLCEVKRGARSLVFADGRPGARVMVLTEAPERDEDLEGRPCVGAVGAMLDRMFAAIGLSRTSPDSETGLYLAAVMPWRPPGDRSPTPEETAMMRPFVERHIALADPDVIVLMGNAPCATLLGAKGVLRLRGSWTEVLGKPALPMVHPGQLLRNPLLKREAWADLLALQARLRGA